MTWKQQITRRTENATCVFGVWSEPPRMAHGARFVERCTVLSVSFGTGDACTIRNAPCAASRVSQECVIAARQGDANGMQKGRQAVIKPCACCFKRKPRKGRVTCQRCSDLNKKNAKLLYWANRKAGVCVTCRTRQAQLNAVRCAVCAAYMRERKRI